ncbi:DNA repair protein RadC [Klebsiella pneumoniae]|uniref:DNA repair protein RadC n=1 Tax=Klebsiella pneumoniae TaxID=573 RepID=A0A377XGJ1_KLEPN|nr:DNA repair protein RadC [Klebsiella pneumoniae]
MDGMENLMPREKMLQYGIETLTDVELLALFLRVGTRRQDVPQLCPGVTTAFWLTLRSAFR